MSTARDVEFSESPGDEEHASLKGRKREDLQQKFGGCKSWEPDQLQTVMIRNLPRKLREELLLLELEEFLPPGSYDFFYLPWSNRRSSNDGYAFVNCLSASTAHGLINGLDGQPWKLVAHSKPIRIVPAHIQGLTLNLLHYMNSQVVGGEHFHSPIVLHNGEQMDFQEAVQMYCPPELIFQHSKDKPRPQSTLARELRIAGLPAGPLVRSCPGQLERRCRGGAAAEWSDEGVKLALMSTCSSLSVPSQLKTCDHSASSEVNLLEADSSMCGGQRPELVQLLSSDTYGDAWTKLNEQLRATLVMCKGQLSPGDSP